MKDSLWNAFKLLWWSVKAERNKNYHLALNYAEQSKAMAERLIKK